MEKVSIIIVNWNTGDLLVNCLQSIIDLPEQGSIGSVVVIDNASHDDSVKKARAVANTSPNMHIVLSGENLGFSRANNIGIARVQETNPQDHILLLNPDTEMRAGSLTALTAALEKHPKVGIVGPKLLNTDGTTQESVRRFPTFSVVAAIFLKLQRIFPGMEMWQKYMYTDFTYTEEKVVPQVMGACFLIRREVIAQIGVLDTRFWIWFEEVDFAKRALDAGWETLYTPAGEVMHVMGASFHQLVGFRKSFPFIQSGLIYASKHFTFFQVIALYALLPFAMLMTIPALFAHMQQQENTTKHL